MKEEEEEEEEENSPKPVSDEDLIHHLREFLRNSDLNTTTTAIVRRKLEDDFGVDLSDRKSFIRQQVDLFLQTQMEKSAGEDDDVEEDDDEEKAKVKSESKEDEDSDEGISSGEEMSSNSNGKGRKKSVKNKDVKKRTAGGFAKVCSLSPELQNVVGAPEMARTEVVKQIWKYIQARDLQDPSNRKNIRCDEALRAVFKVDVIGMLQMNKSLTRHIWPLGSDAAPDPSTIKEKPPKEKTRKRKKREDDGQAKERRVNCSGFLAPYPLSDALIKFIGTGESAMPRAAVVKLIWGYIKEHNLQDPTDKKTILCDEKLKELFNVDSFVGFTVPRLLKDHFIKGQPSQSQ